MPKTAAKPAVTLHEALSAAFTAVMAAWDEREVDASARAGFPLGDFVKAAEEVFDSEVAERYADQLIDDTRIRSMEFRNGFKMDIDAAREITANYVAAARAMLGDAENYSETPVEFEVKLAGELERYALIVQRVGKLTPHQARQKAEAERDALRAELDALKAAADA